MHEKTIVVFWGLTASGKSYLSSAWAEKNGYPRLNTDLVRKTVVAPDARGGRSRIGQGIYTPECTRQTYDTLLVLAQEALEQAAVVILDGSYLRREERLRVLECFRNKTRVLFVLCSCSEAVTGERLRLRRSDENAVSDGTPAVYRHQLSQWSEPTEIPRGQLLRLDTDAPLEYLMERLDHFLV